VSSSAAIDAQVPAWGTEIEPVEFGGVSYRMYADRPRDVGDILAYADRWGERPHIVQGERVITFADLRSATRSKATELRSTGLRRGDRVVLLGFNSPDWVINFWAVVSVGAVPVLANAWWSSEELRDALELMRPVLVLADERAATRLPEGCPTAPWPCPIEVEAVSAEAPAPAQTASLSGPDENAPAAVIFTSGTSGRPKAVLLAHRSLLAGLHMLLHITNRLPQQVTEGDGSTALHTGPMFHIGGIQTLLRAVIVGDTLIMPRGKFEPGDVLELIETWKVSRWSAVPTMVSRVLEHPDVQTRDVRSLRSLTVGGAPVHGEFLARLRAGFPGVEPRVATGYGLTENGGQATAASGRDTTERPGCSGRALPCVELRIQPTEGFADGEILVRSPTQMLGFFGDDASPIDAAGWLHTGDLGRLDDDGYLWITGRSKDMIIRGGENISPASVEEGLNSLPGVVESVVFGVPDPDLGEDVMAVVSVTGDVTPEFLSAQLRARLASFAIPSRWQIVDKPLPVNHAGKIDKPAIAAAARASIQSTPGRSASEEPAS
jgi:acyl-CoA synthetase (AMP-forming)/AMP-acid ligase II